MVHNEDGAPIRSNLSPREFEEYRLKMIEDDLLETLKHKGKERMRDPPEEEQEMKEEQSPSTSLGETLLDLSLNVSSKDASTEPGPSQASTSLADSELAAAAITAATATAITATAATATATATVTAATTAAANPATIRAPSGSTSLADAPAHLLNFQDAERQFILMRNEINQLTAWRAEMQQWVILVEQWVGRVNSHIEESQN